MNRLLSVSSLDDLANYFGYTSYERFKGLVYPEPTYTVFSIPKRKGGSRLICAPGLRLKELQRQLAEDIRDAFGNRSPVANSFIKGRGIVRNALPHVGRESVVRVDLVDFFGHIHFGRVKGVFEGDPFRLSPTVASVLSHLCCYKSKLPQGAPTSAALTNFVCLGLDGELARLAKRYKGRYSRYADDLTFSFKNLSIKQLTRDFVETTTLPSGTTQVRAGKKLRTVIEEHGFVINESKTCGADRTARQLVTGLVVNRYLGVPSKFTNKLRRALHLWDAYGLSYAEARCLPNLQDRTYGSGKAATFIPLLRGKLNYLSMVTGQSGHPYQKLALSFNRLVMRDFPPGGRTFVGIDPAVSTYQDAIIATWYLIADDLHESTAFRFQGGVWITCAHCVGDFGSKSLYNELLATSGDWKVELELRVVAIDWDRDLAILRPMPMRAVPRYLAYFLRSPTVVQIQDRVGTIGFPNVRLHQPPIFLGAKVIATRPRRGVARLEIDKQIMHGNSGGPLFDEKYKVVGVVSESALHSSGRSGNGENSCISVSEIDNVRGT